MQTSFQKVALSTLILASSAFATSDLLSVATSGAVVSGYSSEAKVLNNDEMKNVVGGTYLEYGAYRAGAYQMIQTFGLVKEGFKGRNVWVVGERFGKNTTDGYSIYLTYNNPSTLYANGQYKYTSHGQGLNAVEVTRDGQSLPLLYQHVNDSMKHMYKYKF